MHGHVAGMSQNLAIVAVILFSFITTWLAIIEFL